ncbi:hypothetical protein J6590_084914 [Homalodisca vitripennis]|nr:hypothetical protein J6590_084914 [Homalodisca vitripennis]
MRYTRLRYIWMVLSRGGQVQLVTVIDSLCSIAFRASLTIGVKDTRLRYIRMVLSRGGQVWVCDRDSLSQ